MLSKDLVGDSSCIILPVKRLLCRLQRIAFGVQLPFPLKGGLVFRLDLRAKLRHPSRLVLHPLAHRLRCRRLGILQPQPLPFAPFVVRLQMC